MKKNIFVFGFLIVLFGTAIIQYKASLPKKTIEIKQYLSAVQTITIDGVKNTKKERAILGTTALQLLTSSHKVVTKGENKNAFITEIDARAANQDAREFWAFYVNGTQATVGAGAYIIKNNDTIEWKIETY